jgi:hypothetical protein
MTAAADTVADAVQSFTPAWDVEGNDLQSMEITTTVPEVIIKEKNITDAVKNDPRTNSTCEAY